MAFIDEVFKANSAILNTLLTILNERLFDNGTERLPVPLLCLVAASNELPESEELDALYDRFLLRSQVQQVRSPLSVHAIALEACASARHFQFRNRRSRIQQVATQSQSRPLRCHFRVVSGAFFRDQWQNDEQSQNINHLSGMRSPL